MSLSYFKGVILQPKASFTLPATSKESSYGNMTIDHWQMNVTLSSDMTKFGNTLGKKKTHPKSK